MEKGSTNFLRAAVLALSTLVFIACLFFLPALHREWPLQYPDMAYMRYVVMAAIITTAAAFFAATFQAMKLLSYVDKDQVFSMLSVNALKHIKYCAVVIVVLYMAGMPLLYYMAQADDAPGLVLIGMIVVFAASVIATFAAVLQKLLRSAIALKKENDLTV